MNIDFDLIRNAYGRLVLTKSDGQMYENVVPVRAFPFKTPNDNIALVNDKGQEVVWIDRLSELPESLRKLVLDELESRELTPEIQAISGVTSFVTPCIWDVTTDRGKTSLVLQDEGDIRRVSSNSLLILDNHGVPFFIRNIMGLDKHSRNILDRFI